ncbi:hypothetical protein C8R46DRAFT_1315033 [Mycena filopes]|nr:hypothetical protein C8R46DRAFT_1315033 [Mycena filopes]
MASPLRNIDIVGADLRGLFQGHKVTAVRKDAQSGKYTIEFASGVSVEIVDTPIYSGVTFVGTNIDMSKNVHLNAFVGKGTVVALSDGKGLLAQRNSTHVILYSALRGPEEWAKTSAVAQAETAEEKIALMLEEFDDWYDELRELLRVGEDPTMRPICALPSDSLPRSETENILVLLGDAPRTLTLRGGWREPRNGGRSGSREGAGGWKGTRR